MKKRSLLLGLAGGIFIGIYGVCAAIYCHSTQEEGNMLLGYTAMIIAFSVVFVAIKKQRDDNSGIITFGSAFRTGILVAFIASTIYVIAWVLEYKIFMPDFMDKYVAHSLQQLRQSGASAATIKATNDQMNFYVNMYHSIFGVIFLTYLEIFPVGLIMTLLAALILKRKDKGGQVVSSVA